MLTGPEQVLQGPEQVLQGPEQVLRAQEAHIFRGDFHKTKNPRKTQHHTTQMR